MACVKVVTGYCEIPNHPRGATDYRALGQQLIDGLTPTHEVFAFDDKDTKVEQTWLANILKSVPGITHSVADNPDKNTLAYHCVQHNKFVWLAHAAQEDANSDNPADVYAWVDYGIGHLKDYNIQDVLKYLDHAQDFGVITMPGCWPRRDEIRPDIPCWRFCGGLIAVPRSLINPFVKFCMAAALRQISTTKNVEWEVNTLARVENMGHLPIVWYAADHDMSMFRNAP